MSASARRSRSSLCGRLRPHHRRRRTWGLERGVSGAGRGPPGRPDRCRPFSPGEAVRGRGHAQGRRARCYALAPSVCRSFNAIEFNLWGKRRNRFTHPGIVLQTVCRPEFDNRLVQENLSRRNFTFMEGRRVTGVEYDGRFIVRTDAGTVTGAQLIGADGAYSIVNRTFRIGRHARWRPPSRSTFRAPGARRRRTPCRASTTAPSDRATAGCFRRTTTGPWASTRCLHGRRTFASSWRPTSARRDCLAYDCLDGMEAFRVPVGGFR